MHILIALAGIAITAYVWFNRVQRGAEVATDLLEAASDVKNAARRLGFRRRANQHAVEGIDDPNLAISGMAMAFLELDDLPTADTRAATDISLRKHLNMDADTASEVAILGRWFVSECGSPDAAFTRLAKKLRKIHGPASFEPLMAILNDIATSGTGTPSAKQSEALSDLARIFHLK